MKNWLTKITDFSKSFPNNFFCLVLLTLMFSGCNEEGGFLGRELLPSDDNIQVGYENNFDITATTEKTPEQYTYGVDTLLVGRLDDEVFGQVRTSFAAQFIYDIATPTVFVGQNPTVHSPVLNLGLLNTYGKEDVYPQLNIYELLEIPDSANSYSDTDIEAYKGKLLNAEPSKKEGNFIRIPLQNSYIQDILEFMNTDTTLQFASADDTTQTLYNQFKEIYRGLYVEASPDEGSNAIARITSAYTASFISFTVETNNEDTSLTKTLYLPFDHDTIETFRANYIQHDYSNTELEDSIAQSSTSKFYVQGFNGLQGRLTISGLEEFKNAVNSDIAVNRASLFIPFDLEDNTALTFKRPKRLMLSFLDGEFLPASFNLNNNFPMSLVFANRFGGRLDVSAGGYRFNVSNYVQEYVNGEVTSNEFYIYVPDLLKRDGDFSVVEDIRHAITFPDRVVLSNGADSRKITLEVFYNELGE